MALTLDRYLLTVVFEGLDSFTTTRTYEINAANYTDASTAVTAFLADLAVVSDAAIIETRLSEIKIDTAASSSANVFVQAAMTLNLNTAGKRAAHNIPAPDASIVSGKYVVSDAANLLAYLDNFETGGAMRISDGEAIASTNQVVKGRVRTVNSSISQY